MADKYDVIWDARTGHYVARHERCRNGDELRWDERAHADERAFAYWRELPTGFLGLKPRAEDRPAVIMGTFDGYAKASEAIADYPSGGAYA